MRRPIRSIALLATTLAAGGFGGAAAFHLHLEKSEPADKAALAKAPAELKLWFSEPAEVALTKLTLTRDLTRGKDTIAVAKPSQASATDAPIVAKITGAVAAGTYTVGWRTMGKDGHAVTGTFGFTLRAAATSQDQR